MSLDIGFETIGNATLVVHDGGPVLATDPWLHGPAYFGSWTLSHEVPEEQRAAVGACKWIWVSHGHPDHLSMPSMAELRDKEILLPDHVGGRIRDALLRDGFRVTVMQDRVWHQLAPRVRVCSIADFNQDAVLLVDLDGVLIANLNDASDRAWGRFVRAQAKKSRNSFMLALSGYGDADMINFFDADGARIPPYASRRLPPGPAIAKRLERLALRNFIPFASMHRYQRSDSVWANEYTTPADEHRIGFESAGREVLPAFVRYDLLRDEATPIGPRPNDLVVHEPAEFGDDWSEALEPDEADALRRYFGRITTLAGVVDEVVFSVGGTDTSIPIGNGTGRAVRFEVPRRSLVDAVRWEIFDDLLIGNFMRTTLSGDWDATAFGRDFSPLVAKYADNGLARTPGELREYMRVYRSRARLDAALWELDLRRERVVTAAARRVRSHVHAGSPVHRAGKAAYRRIRTR